MTKFDDDDATVRKKDAAKYVGLSFSAMDRLEAAGKFPKRFPISGDFRTSPVGYRLGDLRAFNRARQSRLPWTPS